MNKPNLEPVSDNLDIDIKYGLCSTKNFIDFLMFI